MKRISRNVRVLGWVSLFNDISSEMLYPVIPVFLTAVLNAPMSVVGVIEGIAESTASLFKGLSGWYSDRVRKRVPFAVTGYAMSAASRPILALARGWPAVLLARFIDRLGKGIRTSARDALISDSTRPEHRGSAFGYHRAMDTVGAVGGPLLALLFIRQMGEAYRALFLLAFFPALIGWLLLVLFVRESTSPASARPASAGKSLSVLGRPFRAFLAVSAVFAMGNSSDAFLILRAKDVGFSTSDVILAYCLYNASYAVLSYPAGLLSDRIGRKSVLIAGYLVFALVYAGFSVAVRPAHCWALFFVYGFYTAFTEGVSKAMIADLAGTEGIATAMGAWQAITGIAALLANILAGALWQWIGPEAPFAYGAATAILAVILLVSFVGESRPGAGHGSPRRPR